MHNVMKYPVYFFFEGFPNTCNLHLPLNYSNKIRYNNTENNYAISFDIFGTYVLLSNDHTFRFLTVKGNMTIYSFLMSHLRKRRSNIQQKKLQMDIGFVLMNSPGLRKSSRIFTGFFLITFLRFPVSTYN